MFFYASQDNKAGERVVKSYDKASQRDQYIKGEANLYDGIRTLNLETGDFDQGAMPGPDEVVVRSYIDTRKPPQDILNGDFQVYAMGKDGKWKPTSFRAATYGPANTLAKALATIYGKVIVVDHREIADRNGPRSTRVEDDQPM